VLRKGAHTNRPLQKIATSRLDKVRKFDLHLKSTFHGPIVVDEGTRQHWQKLQRLISLFWLVFCLAPVEQVSGQP
jgi:hypothetical protein